MKLRPLLPLALALSASALAADEKAATPEQLDFFEKKIRPVLADKCYKCHSEKSEKLKGGLLLDTREGIRRGGDNGPAVVPGNPADSLLIEAVRYTNKDFAMPPEKSGGKLPDAVIADFEAWVKMGAPDPRKGQAKVVKKTDMEEAKKWWSFQPPRKADAPAVKDAAWPRGEIDRFLLAALETKGLKPAPDADKATLLRRVYFDLTGLPPSLKETDDFIRNTSPEALAQAVDRLLASPQFGEHWGRHWLDVARYAESSGKDSNIAYPHAWRYRDYVIAAFNSGKPYDRFLREQIAGDLLPSADHREQAGHLIATGFLAIGAKSHNEQNSLQFHLDLADEQIDTLSQATMGMTFACARCHDHKFDPIPQRDYYALAGIFLSTETRYGTATSVQNRRPSELVELPRDAGLPLVQEAVSSDEVVRKKTTLEDKRKEQQEFIADRFAQRRSPEQANAPAPTTGNDQIRRIRLLNETGALDAQVKSYYDDGQPKALAMGVKDRPNSAADGFGGLRGRRPGMGGAPSRFFGVPPREFAMVSDARLYTRGDPAKPAELVPRGFPALLTQGAAPQIPNGTSGRRELAEWITSPANPLTARVFVNRTWHWLFGRGLVESCDNFGTTGGKPANQALLDTLAVRFVENGWNVKALIREIAISHAYALSSTYDDAAFRADPENSLVWRANKRRLPAEALRDAMLAASGMLDLTPPAGSLIAKSGDAPIDGPRNIGINPTVLANSGTATNARSIYLPIARELPPDVLAVFDFVDSTLVTGSRETTNVPSQALYLLNNSFVAKQAEALGDRILRAYPAGPNGGAAANLDERIRYATWIVFNRPPTAADRQAALGFFSKFPSNWQRDDKSSAGIKDAADVKAAWTSYARALLASAEFRYLN
jgi:hypothetical protein